MEIKVLDIEIVPDNEKLKGIDPIVFKKVLSKQKDFKNINFKYNY